MCRNIDACKQLSMMTRSALGPHGKSHTFHGVFWKYGAFFSFFEFTIIHQCI